MFWRFGGYANISTIDSILDKPDVTLDELLDEQDLIQELKSQTPKLIEFLRDDAILERLLNLVVAAKAPEVDEDETKEQSSAGKRSSSESGGFFSKSRSKVRSESRHDEESDAEKQEKQRLKQAYVACEILSCDVWSITEAILANPDHLRTFWEYMKTPAPLDPLQAGYFTKVNESLLEKKTEEMVVFVKTLDAVVKNMMQHVDCPMVMDLLLKLISLEKDKGGQGIVDWIQSQDLIPILVSYINPEYPASIQTSAGDFLKAIITISANATGQDSSVIGPNELTRQLVSEPCVSSLIGEMLRGGNPLTVGVGIIIEVIRKNNSDYDIETGVGPIPKSSDPIYLGTLLRIFSNHISDFMLLILSPNHTIVTNNGSETVRRSDLKVAWGEKIEPLGFDRFKTCELMAELLHCSNMALLNEKGGEAEVMARDTERERLKAEGKLAAADLPQNMDFGTSVDSSGFHHAEAFCADEKSSEKRLEIQNNLDEDGFEKVAMSEAMPDAERQEKIRPDQDTDAEFVDQPLTPPQKPSTNTDEQNVSQNLSLTPNSVGLNDQVEHLDLDKDVDMIDTPDIVRASNSPSSSPPSKPRISLLTQQLKVGKPLDMSSENEKDPVEQPAPLFAKRPEANKPAEVHLQPPAAEEGEKADPGSETEDGSLSMLIGDQTQQDLPIIEKEDDGSPLVGDLLKMMFVENLVVPTILDFFFRFPWNNFLHNVVYDVVQQVFNGQMDRGFNRHLAIDLFEAGRITERIVEGQENSDKAQQEHDMRLGYMGHLTLIAEEVVKFNERQPPEFLSPAVVAKVTDQQWIEYVEQTLAETRERDNAILGGVRPDMQGGPRQAVLNAVNAASGGYKHSGSSALADAGLGGNGVGGLDSMDLANAGYSGNSLLSGFGSSSDEEDEDMEEAELGESDAHHVSQSIDEDDQVGNPSFEDVDMVYRASDDKQSTPAAIPAPLSIPPSRARRQLAALLAQKKRLAAAGTIPEDPEESAGSGSDAAMDEALSQAAAGLDLSTAEHDNDGRERHHDAFRRNSDSEDDSDEEEDDHTTLTGEQSHAAVGTGLRRQTTREAEERRPLDDGDDDGDEDEENDTGEESTSERATDDSTGEEDEGEEGGEAASEPTAMQAKLQEQEKLLKQWGLTVDKPAMAGSSQQAVDEDDEDDDEEPVEIGSKFMRRRGSST